MDKIKILWADDEIDLLRPHILFLEQKGFLVTTSVSGDGAIEWVERENFDIIFLDENMPGLSGLDVLVKIKKIKKGIPVVMITKSEEEYIMEEAIGGEISDYLIKPVNPHQILLSIKKNLDDKRLISEKNLVDYQKEFRQITMRLSDRLDMDEWMQLYSDLVFWEIKLAKGENKDMLSILESQLSEANLLFARYVTNNYEDWFTHPSDDTPLLSHNVLQKKVFPLIGETPIFVFVIDCLRLDQWKILQSILNNHFKVIQDELYCSILPTATHYARNAFFSGLMPLEIQKKYPDKWKSEHDEGSKNDEERFLIGENLKRNGHQVKYRYEKILNIDRSKKFVEQLNDYLQNDINFIVYNFVDMLSHARTDTKIIRELAEDEKAFRNITETWFKNSPLLEALKKLSKEKCKIVITTDHGTIKVDNPLKIMGDKDLNTNLRYKIGKNISYDSKTILESLQPEKIRLPKNHISDKYIFAKERDFFAYQNNYNHFANYYKNTFQHGGISLEEMIVPLAFLETK